MNAQSGRTLSGIDHLRQSLRDILTTPIGTRVMRRDYGSRLYQLVDAPMNNTTLVELYAATAEAVARWEPRFKLTRVRTESASPGHILLTLEGEYLPTGEMINLDGIQVS
ncbi:GPW/gp25 family protein [Vreelandella janggokensis]|uniref:GPW/gp25 family protein n=1 Tax=Vreelandella janggokensis TaxID=370767 RepID=UPI00286630A8|nr:GPW/gp25 family protein [Halomonas janggokensis]MDR5887562.1 GPW/gp25 family protein [Halomonas janggokensis]